MNVFDQLVHNVLKAADTGSPFAVGVVTDVGLAAAADGHDLVTVNYLGTKTRVTHDPDMPFVVGDVVLLARTQPMYVLGRIAGTPPAI